MPVRVMVSTVVVRSGTASRRAAAFWMPMASGQQHGQDVARGAAADSLADAATASAAATRISSQAAALSKEQPAAVVADAAGQRYANPLLPRP